MEKKKILIFSNKFSPAHFSHLVAFYKGYEELNYDCMLVLDRKYEDFVNQYKGILKVKFNDETNFENVDHVIIYNISTIDSKYLKKVMDKKTTLHVIVHEPWPGMKKTIKNYFDKVEPLNETIKSFGRNYFLKKLLKKGAKIIVCSNNAAKVYNKEKISVLPLIFEDENTNIINDKVEKKYFSFIGSATPAHGFNEYVNFIKANRDKDILFQIATSSNINETLKDELLQEMIKNNKLIVQQGRFLTNEEINLAYLKSSSTWLLYKRSTQSGVICKSWMFGTPVICSNIGSFGEYVDGTNGIILENINNEEILNKYMQINNDLDNMSKSSRESFDKHFNYKYKLELLKKIIEN